MPDFEQATGPVTEAPADVVVVGVREGLEPAGAAARVDRALEGELTRHLDRIGFSAEVGEVTVLPTFGRLPQDAVLVAGLGGRKVTHDEVRRAGGAAARQARTYRVVALDLASGVPGGVQAAVEGFLLGSYEFTRYKSSAEPPRTKRVLVFGAGGKPEIERAGTIAEAVNWARDLVNEPAQFRGPAGFAELARARAEAAGVAVEILDEKAMAKAGMGGILAVGHGSGSPPRFLTLTYAPRGARGFVGAVGKGITFDAGGLSLKTAEGMETMKIDCSGAAAVIAAVTALPALRPKIKVVAALPLAENMPGGEALRPGDVIRHYGGRTSEVLNTDAEGRLVLADALAWMAERKPDAMVDLATLTGGMVTALGKKVAGFFANRPRLSREIIDAAGRTGERIWEMPLLDDLRRDIDSAVADVRNVIGNTPGKRYASPIVGALFLRDFVGDTPWAHIDIAGPAYSEEDEHHFTRGATGVGTRLLIDWIEHRARSG